MRIISELVYKLAESLRIADLGSMIDASAEQLKGYMELGIRPEVLEDFNYKAMLKSLIPPGTGEAEAYSIVEGMVWRFITGEQEDPRYKLKERKEEKEEAVKDLNVTTQLWKKGDGQKVLVQLRAAMDDMLLKHGVSAEDLNKVKNEILYEDSGPMKGESLEVFGKVKKEITSFLGKTISDRMKSARDRVLIKLKEKAPEEVLEPTVDEAERGVMKERISPLWLGLEGVDVEAISEFVKKNYPEYQYKIFENAISDKPLSDADMAKSLKGEKEMTGQTVGNIKTRIMKTIRERFFPGVPQRKPEEIGDIKWKELDKEDLKDFEDYLFDKHMDEASEEVKSNVKKFLDGLVAGKTVKDIADESGAGLSSLKQYSVRYLKPGYAGWLKDRIKDQAKKAFFERLFTAMEGEMIDYDHVEAEIERHPWTPFDDPHKKKPSTEEEKDPKAPKEKRPREFDLGTLKSTIQEKILDKHNFNVLIDFSSKYDWTDIGLGKFSPKVDPDEGFTEDDPEFKWVSYNATIHQKIKRGKQGMAIDYNFKQKLFDNGGVDGHPESTIKMTVDSGDGAVEMTEASEVQGFLDKYFVGLAEKEIPVLSDSGISAKYKNSRLDRVYVNTHDFEEKMGGLGISNLAHRERAKEYQEFLQKRREHLRGPGVTHEDYSWDTLLEFFKRYLQKKDVEKKTQAKHYEDILKRDKGKTDHLKLHEMTQFMHEHQKDMEKKLREKKIDPLEGLKGAPEVKEFEPKKDEEGKK